MPRDNICMYVRTFVLMSVVVNSCSGNVCCVPAVVENSDIFLPWSVEVCCMFV